MRNHGAQLEHVGFLCGGPLDGEAALVVVFEQTMMRLVWLEQKRWAQILAGHGLTVPQFLVLAAIWERQNGCHMGQLAGEMLQSSATMTGTVARLVRMELVQRQAVANDRRLVLVDLTGVGRELLERVRSERLARVQEILDHLPEAESRELIRLIGKYLEASASSR